MNSSKGFYVYNFNAKTGELTWVSSTDSSANSSFFAVSNNGTNVYAVPESGGKSLGRVSAYSFGKKKRTFSFNNSTSTRPDSSCYLSVSPNYSRLPLANYSGGSAAMFFLNMDGSIKPFSQLVDDSIYKTSSEEARINVHATVFSSDENYQYTPDLGVDKVMVYEVNPENKHRLILTSTCFAASGKSSGTPHMAFHPDKRFAYLIHKKGDMLSSFQYQNSQLIYIQQIPAFPKEFISEMVVSNDGKFLYVTKYGLLFINTSLRRLTLVGYWPILAKARRNFMTDPTANYLLVANQNSNNIVIFERDKVTGSLQTIITLLSQIPKFLNKCYYPLL